MTGWVEIAAVAFVAQLAVLPGEKAQYVIAGLATRYDPWVVVAAATAAFGGWTALEIAFGQALQTALSPTLLDALTALLFLAFAVLLYRSAPEDGGADTGSVARETDGGVAAAAPSVGAPTVFGRDLSEALGGFLPVVALLAVGEFGDKTQLVTIGLAAKYGATSAIWAGEMLAILPISLANAFFFHKFSHRVDRRTAHLFGAALFAFFAVDTALSVVTGFSLWEAFIGSVAHAVAGVV